MDYLPERAYRRQCGWSKELRVERHTLDWESRKRNSVRSVKKERREKRERERSKYIWKRWEREERCECEKTWSKQIERENLA